MFEQIHNANRIRGVPAVFHRHFGRDILQARFEIDLAFFLKLEQRESHKRLADRAHAKFRFTRHVAICGDVCLSDSAAPKERAVGNQRYSRTGHMFFVEDILHRLLQLCERFRMGQIFLLLCARKNREKQKDSEAQAERKT